MKSARYIVFGMLLLLLACAPDIDVERNEILQYLKSKNMKAIDTLGVFVVIDDEGSELKPKEKSTITLSFEARYLDDEVFDKSPVNQDVKINISTALVGLKSGLTFFGKNGKGTIIIPSSLGYGNNPPFGVRKDAILVYQVHVIDF